MIPNPSAAIGSRIRMYRKLSHLNLEDLAHKIHKSRGTISKYESGDIVLDINTLYAIAKALNISVSYLIDPDDEDLDVPELESPIDLTGIIHLYHCQHNKVYGSLMQIGPLDKHRNCDASLYYKCSDLISFSDCECVYHGRCHVSDNTITFVLKNFHCDAEQTMISFFIPVSSYDFLTGIMLGILNETLRPTAFRVVLSRKIMSLPRLLPYLNHTKEDLRQFKKDQTLLPAKNTH